MRIFILDDMRTPNATFIDAALDASGEGGTVDVNPNCAVGLETLMYANDFNELWLDYDLGMNADGTFATADPVVDWLCEQAFWGFPYPCEVIHLHTDNAVGREKMKLVLERYGYTVKISDFPY